MSNTNTSGDRIKTLAWEQGRSISWLADEVGCSRSTMYRILDKNPAERSKGDELILDAAARAVGLDLLTADFFKGRAVTLPRSLFAELRTASSETKAYSYEEAWKRSWVREHGAEALAAAVERAWLAEAELAGAR